jgi:hypothetical protein
MATDFLGPILARYVEAAIPVLDPPVGRVVYVAPGLEVAWDDCCDGQLHARVIQLVPHTSSSTRPAAGPPCGVEYWIATIALGVIRCAHSLNDDGSAPTDAEVSSDGQQMLADMAELQQVVLCSPDTWQVLQWLPAGPLGGCHGGEWTFQVKVPTCGCDVVATPI